MSNGRSLLAALSGLCVSTAKAWGCMWAESSSKRLVPPIPLAWRHTSEPRVAAASTAILCCRSAHITCAVTALRQQQKTWSTSRG